MVASMNNYPKTLRRNISWTRLCMKSYFTIGNARLIGPLSFDFIFNEAEALAETPYVVESVEEDVLSAKKKKQFGKRDKGLEGLPVQEIQHVLPEEQRNEIFGANDWKQLPDEIFKRVKVESA